MAIRKRAISIQKWDASWDAERASELPLHRLAVEADDAHVFEETGEVGTGELQEAFDLVGLRTERFAVARLSKLITFPGQLGELAESLLNGCQLRQDSGGLEVALTVVAGRRE